MSSGGLIILSVDVNYNEFLFECQCGMEEMGQCWVSEEPHSWALILYVFEKNS